MGCVCVCGHIIGLSPRDEAIVRYHDVLARCYVTPVDYVQHIRIMCIHNCLNIHIPYAYHNILQYLG